MEGLSMFTILLILNLVQLRQAQDFCKGRSNGVYAFLRDNTKYITCAADDAFIMACPRGLVFNEEFGHCIYQDYTNTFTGLTRTDAVNKCKAIGWTVGYTTDKSLVCTAPGHSEWTICNKCDTWRLLVWADGGMDQSPCGEIYQTKAGRWYGGHSPCACGWNLPECPGPWADHKPTKKPVTEPITRQRGFCRGKIDGVYPFQNDCSKFITCVSDNMFVSQCPTHLLFDEQKHFCNYEWGITHLKCKQGVQSDVVLGHAYYGDWSSKYICPDNGYINGFRLKVEDEHDGDNTAINGIEVSCKNGETGKSAEFSRGSWKRWQNCSNGHHVWSFNYRSAKYSETGDNSGGNDVNMVCTDNVKLLGGGNRGGSWVCEGAYCSCSHRNATLCGIQTKGVKDIEGDKDAVGITKMNFICCERH